MKALVRMNGRKAKRRVDAQPTCSPFFVITPTQGIMQDDWPWTLTHKASGCSTGRGSDIKLMRKYAGILAALPIPWKRIRTPMGVLRSWQKLPPEIREWRNRFVDAMKG